MATDEMESAMKTWYSKMIKMEQIDNAKTGAALRELRKSKGVSLRKMAERMKISPSYLSDLERGNRYWDRPKHDRFVRLCK